ncbi:MAG: (Fe-S)-binding protein [Anaerolineae bacterium]|jgi:L-lactate dehydrogenase complex protein LldE|nr:(Fe-S)-binding protein [Anaerolineae bacterium]
MTKVQLFITCLGESFFSHVLRDMVTVLERLGMQVEMPEGQACCGQPLYNSGFQSQTVAPARNWLKVFAPTEGYIVAPSGSCAEFARHRYPQLFPPGTWEHGAAVETAARTFEFTEFLTKVLGVTDVGARFPHKVTYHASCHILRGLGLRDEPKQLLSAVRGLEFVPLNNEETCCGFGGIFSVVYPEVSRAMMTEKVRNVEASGAEAVVVSEPGCLMNVAGGLRKAGSTMRAMHIIEVLAAEE